MSCFNSISILSFAGRKRYCILWCPPRIEPSSDCPDGDAGPLSPLHQQLGNSKSSYSSVSPTITLLLFPCSPVTIFRSVLSIIVPPFYRHAFRTLTHVSEKIYKSVVSAPASTDSDTSTAVILITRCTDTITTRQHCVVGGEGWGLSTYTTMTMLPAPFTATTASAMASSEIVRWAFSVVATVTPTKPNNLSPDSVGNGCHSPELSARQIMSAPMAFAKFDAFTGGEF